MTIWTISDLHLSGVQPKPMDIFGPHWKNHAQRIAAAWQTRVAADDIVLIAGDISWAMKLSDALIDLRWIDALPGRKVMIKGNHDYWWDRVGPLRPLLPPSISAIEADAIDLGELVVCGTRGWIVPDTPGFDESKDLRIYNRELGRLERALAMAQRLAKGTRPIVAMIHYPPFLNRQPTEFAHRLSNAGVAACIYGHLHRPNDWAGAVQGQIDGVFYQLTACDYLNFGPVAVRGLNM
jgi:predicted phosphohydrolase